LLVVNPNTDGGITAALRLAAHAAAPAGLRAVVLNPETGPRAIESAADRRAAAAAVLALLRRRPHDGYDGYVMACFDDIAVAEARAQTARPVFSLAQAAIEAAVARGLAFTVVTTVTQAVAGIRDLLERYGAAGLGTVRATGVGVGPSAARTPLAEARLHGAIEDARRHDGARQIVLGSGAYTGRAGELARRYGLPVEDGIGPALRRAAGLPIEAAARPA
ncbi:aspartate/glutamate racemase family protein, partial [Verticiella sediminum]